MADFTYFTGTRNSGGTTFNAQYYGAQTSTHFEILNENGVPIESEEGVGFTYDWNGFFNGGTIKSTYFFSGTGELVSQQLNQNVDVGTRNNMLSAGESAYDFEQYVRRGNDHVLGSEDADSLMGSEGNDVIDGGAGVDVLTYAGFGEAVKINLAAGTATTSKGTTRVSNVEDIEGTTYADTLTGNAGNNQIQGFAGADRIDGGAGFDTVLYSDAAGAVKVNLGTGVVSGGSGADTLVSIERVVGSRFDDVLTGSAAGDTFLGGFGADTIDGGAGTDTVEYGYVTAGVTVDLAKGTASGAAGNDKIANVENVTGSIFADTLTGNTGANVLTGGNGNDTLNGGLGTDKLIGGNGNDVYYVDNAGDIVSETGAVAAVGGTDTVYAGIGYTLGANVENLRLSGTANINGSGNALNNAVVGNAGANLLNGGAGNDTLTGGAGKDSFFFNTALSKNIDKIADFKAVDDTIRLENAVFTKLATANATLSAANFAANAAGKAADANDYIVYDTDSGALFYDADGSGAGVAVQFATLTGHPAITSADFYVV